MGDLSETYWILLTTGGFAFLGLIIRYCLKSKCDQIECGCIKIHRNTAEELPDLEQQSSVGTKSMNSIVRL